MITERYPSLPESKRLRADAEHESLVSKIAEKYPEIPSHIADHVARYVVAGQLDEGDLLDALFSNDFMGFYRVADDVNRSLGWTYAAMCYMLIPSASHGSRAKVEAWVREGGQSGAGEAGD